MEQISTNFNYFKFGKIREQLFSIAMRMDMFAQIFAVLTFDKLWQPGARARLAFKYMHLEWSSVPIDLSEKLDQLLFEMKWMLVKWILTYILDIQRKSSRRSDSAEFNGFVSLKRLMIRSCGSQSHHSDRCCTHIPYWRISSGNISTWYSNDTLHISRISSSWRLCGRRPFPVAWQMARLVGFVVSSCFVMLPWAWDGLRHSPRNLGSTAKIRLGECHVPKLHLSLVARLYSLYSPL